MAPKKTPPTTPEAVTTETKLVVAKLEQAPAITANFDELAAHIERLIVDYRDLVVTDEYVGQAKKDRAYLNSLAKSIDAERLRVKRFVMAPVEAFEASAKALTAPIKEASDAIDAQVKAFEVRQREARRVAIEGHFLDYAGILSDVVPFERILDPKWLNASERLDGVFVAIEKRIERIAIDEATLTDLNLPYIDDAKRVFFETLDMGRAIEENKRRVGDAERRRIFEEERAAIVAEQNRTATPVPASDGADGVQGEPVPAPTPAPVAAPVADEPRSTWQFTVEGATKSDIEKVMAYAKSLGLTGGRARKVAS